VNVCGDFYRHTVTSSGIFERSLKGSWGVRRKVKGP
jgi:hypothetical protein